MQAVPKIEKKNHAKLLQELNKILKAYKQKFFYTHLWMQIMQVHKSTSQWTVGFKKVTIQTMYREYILLRLSVGKIAWGYDYFSFFEMIWYYFQSFELLIQKVNIENCKFSSQWFKHLAVQVLTYVSKFSLHFQRL